MPNKNKYRYTLTIAFKDSITQPLVQDIKTLVEVMEYSDIIDDTVHSVSVVDNTNNSICNFYIIKS